MSGVRVLVGTRKGAFVLTSDGKREKWDVSGPHFAGWEIYHLKGSPADPNRLYASQTSGWFGQIIQRSDDGGKTWHQPGTPPGEPTTTPEGMPKGESNKFVYDTSKETGKPLTTHQFYDGTQHPWEFKRVWHLEPSLTDPNTVYAGVEDAALFRSTDGAKTWPELALHAVAQRRRRPAQRQRRRLVARGQGEFTDRLRVPDRRSRARAGDNLRRPHQRRVGARSARGKAPSLSEPHGRKRVGGAHERSAAARLLRQRVARRDGRGLAR